MNIKRELETLSEAAKRAYDQGLVRGSGGNVSIRLGDRVYISPSGFCLGSLSGEDYICLDLEGNQLSAGKPSKETGMHLECYRRYPKIESIFHLHPLYSIAVTCLASVDRAGRIPIYTPGYALRVGQIPVVPYAMPGSSALAESVAGAMQGRSSVLLANHGVVAAGKNPEAALHLVEEIEENAHLTILLGNDGMALTESQISEMCG